MAPNDKRRHARHSVRGKIKLHWLTPNGNSVHTSGECINISKTGLRVKVERQVEAGLMVRIESAEFHITGLAHVRHCRAQGLGFVVGVEFTGGLTWTEPQSD